MDSLTKDMSVHCGLEDGCLCLSHYHDWWTKALRRMSNFHGAGDSLVSCGRRYLASNFSVEDAPRCPGMPHWKMPLKTPLDAGVGTPVAAWLMAGGGKPGQETSWPAFIGGITCLILLQSGFNWAQQGDWRSSGWLVNGSTGLAAWMWPGWTQNGKLPQAVAVAHVSSTILLKVRLGIRKPRPTATWICPFPTGRSCTLWILFSFLSLSACMALKLTAFSWWWDPSEHRFKHLFLAAAVDAAAASVYHVMLWLLPFKCDAAFAWSVCHLISQEGSLTYSRYILLCFWWLIFVCFHVNVPRFSMSLSV